MTGIAPSKPYQIVSGLLFSLEKGLSLQAENPHLTTFLLEGQIAADRLMEAAERVDLIGSDKISLYLRLLHKCRLWFQKEAEPPVLLGSGAIEGVIQGLLKALDGGEGETRGSCFGRPVKEVMKLDEGRWSVFTTMDLPRTLFFRNPEAWKNPDPDHPDSWKSVSVSPEQTEEWRYRLSEVLLNPTDYIARLIDNLRGASAELKAELIEGIRRAAEQFAGLSKGGLDLFNGVDHPDKGWDFEAQFLQAADFSI